MSCPRPARLSAITSRAALVASRVGSRRLVGNKMVSDSKISPRVEVGGLLWTFLGVSGWERGSLPRKRVEVKSYEVRN